MMNFLSVSLKAGFGLAAIGAAILYSVHINWLKLGIFSALTPEQTYSAFLFSLAAALVAFILLLLVHFASNKPANKSISASNGSIAVDSSGKNSNVTINKR